MIVFVIVTVDARDLSCRTHPSIDADHVAPILCLPITTHPPIMQEVLATHPYSEVPTWGHSGSSFVLHIGNLIRQSKLYFATEQGKEINDLVRAYVNHLCVTA